MVFGLVGWAGEQFDMGKQGRDSMTETSRDFMVEGQRKDINTIFLKLRIADSTGALCLLYFFFFFCFFAFFCFCFCFFSLFSFFPFLFVLKLIFS